MNVLAQICQVLVGLGLLNVWLIRFNKATEYRGGASHSMIEEFAAYGLPKWFCYLIGFLKVTSALFLLAGVFYPGLAIYPAAVVSFLMLGALSMHVKVRDNLKKSIPAASILAMCIVIILGSLNP
jgi:hypothetical protein